MEIAPLAPKLRWRWDNDTASGEFSFAALHAPTRRAGNRAGFETRSRMSSAGSRKLQDVPGAVPERDLTALLKFVPAAEPRLGLEKCEPAV